MPGSAFCVLCLTPEGLPQALHLPMGIVRVLLPIPLRPGILSPLISSDRLVLPREGPRLWLRKPPECHCHETF